MKRKNPFVSALAFFLLALAISMLIDSPPTSNSFVLEGEVKEIVDGDTIKVYVYNTSTLEKVRLKCIDFPDLTPNRKKKWIEKYGVNDTTLEYCYHKGNTLLKDMILNKKVYLYQDIPYERDKYGRLLAFVVYNNTDINNYMIKEGFAIPYLCDKYKRSLDGCLWNSS